MIASHARSLITSLVAREPGLGAPSSEPRVAGAGVGMPSSCGLPRTGLVLVGTRATVAGLYDQLGSLGELIVPAGCIVVDPEPVETATQPADSSTTTLQNLPVFGGLDQLPILAARLQLRGVLISLPAGELLAAAQSAASLAGLATWVVPTLAELLGSHPHPSSIAARTRPGTPAPSRGESVGGTLAQVAPPIDLGALIGRTPHTLDRGAVGKVLAGKRVLITGAGGSIGSELAFVAGTFAPSQLILMERSENALFEIDRQMARRFPGVPRKAILHDVVDAEATLRVLDELRPHAVFHSAAHKHVPLMEDHPAHALTNNLFGTKSISDAAVACGAEQFVMISSDKAVNPTSVMGATKRLAEMYLHGLGARLRESARRTGNAEPTTRVSMVRFGNVLGSSASVLTIWAQQIAEGGPLTLTDLRMTRYFMTIPEAATLVIQSTTLPDPSARGIGVFVLDMGKPVFIAELAARFVEAHGFVPSFKFDGSTLDPALRARLTPWLDRPPAGQDIAGGSLGNGGTIDIVVTSARPGEKLHEELAYAAESLNPTDHPGVLRWAGDGFAADAPAVIERTDRMVAKLAAARFSQDRYQVLSQIRIHVPEMRPAVPAANPSSHPSSG